MVDDHCSRRITVTYGRLPCNEKLPRGNCGCLACAKMWACCKKEHLLCMQTEEKALRSGNMGLNVSPYDPPFAWICCS